VHGARWNWPVRPALLRSFDHNASLDAEQRQAVERILQSRDFVTLFRGGAGHRQELHACGKCRKPCNRDGPGRHVVAPQRQQVMDLEKDGFQNVEKRSARFWRAVPCLNRWRHAGG
jgi:hypothetical protein